MVPKYSGRAIAGRAPLLRIASSLTEPEWCRGYVTNAAGDWAANTGMQGADISWLEAYEHLQNNGGVAGSAVIGVIDTGIRATHQDLAGKVIGGRNFCPAIFCLIGTVNANNWADDNGHGTHVLNLSLGGGAPSAATQNALQYAWNNNVLPVCATGNDGSSLQFVEPTAMHCGNAGHDRRRAGASGVRDRARALTLNLRPACLVSTGRPPSNREGAARSFPVSHFRGEAGRNARGRAGV